MPIFDETPNQDQFLMRPPEEGGGTAEPRPIPTMGERIAGAVQTNWMVALGQRLYREEFPIQVGYNPMDDIRGSIFMQYRDEFSSSRSPEETLATKRRIMEQLDNNEMLEAAGWSGTAWQFGAGLIDPSLALPGGTIYKTARGGYSVGKTFLSTAAAGGGQSAFVEGALQLGQETRTAADSALSIGAGTILSGMIGTGAFALMSRGERARAKAAVDIQRANIDEHAGTITPAEAQRRRAEAMRGTSEPTTVSEFLDNQAAGGGRDAAHLRFAAENAQDIETEIARRKLRAISVEPTTGRVGEPIEPVPVAPASGAVPGAAAVPVAPGAAAVPEPSVSGAAAVPGEAVPPTAAAAAPGAVPGAAVPPGAAPTSNRIVGELHRIFRDQMDLEAASPQARAIYEGLTPEQREVGFRFATLDEVTGVREPGGELIDILDDEVEEFAKAGMAKENAKHAQAYADFVAHINSEARKLGAPEAPVPGAVVAPGAAAGADAPMAAWQRENRAASVDFAQRLGLTDEIGRLAREGKTAAEIVAATGNRLSVDDVRAVRDSLGIVGGQQGGVTMGVMPPPEARVGTAAPAAPATLAAPEAPVLGAAPAATAAIPPEPVPSPPVPLTVKKFVDDWLEGRAWDNPGAAQFLARNAEEIIAEAKARGIVDAPELPEAGAGKTTGDIPAGAATLGLPAAGGAAATDTRQLKLVGALGVEKIPLGMFGAPTRQVLQATSVVGRRAMSVIAELPYLFYDNLNNLATSPHAPIDRLVRMEVNSKRAMLSDQLKDAYSDYRFGERVAIPVARDRWQRMTGNAPDGVLSFSEFKEQVGIAAMNEGGTHAIPQVTAAANWAHDNIFSPWGLRAESVKELGFKRADQVPGERYYPHNWTKELINQQPGAFIGMLTDKYKAQQAVKFEQQQRLSYASAQLKSWTRQINKIQARIQRTEVTGRDIATRMDERAMEVRRLDKRGGTLEERSALLGEQISETEEFIASMREDLKDPDLLTRLDEMEKGLRELRKLDKPMTEAELRKLEEGELGGILTGTTRLAAEIVTGRRKPPKALAADADVAGISPNDLAMQEADTLARGLEEVFVRAGIMDQMKTTRDVARALRDDMEGGVTLADLDRIAAEMERAQGPIPPSVRVEEAEGALGDLRGSMAQVRRVIQDAMSARNRLGTQARATNIRAGETRLGERANLGRLGVLNDRLLNKERQRDLMFDYLQIANRHRDELRAAIEKDIAEFEGTSTVEAQAKLKAREKAEAERTPEQKAKKPRLESADDAVDDAVRKIIADRDKYDLDDEALMLRATETKNRIVGTPDGRFPYEQGGGNETEIGWVPQSSNEPPRGPLAHRQLNLSNAEAAPWIEKDIEKTAHQYLRTMVPDVLLAERTGDVRMTTLLTSTMQDYDRLIREAEANVPLPGKEKMTAKEVAKEVKRLTDEKDMVITKLAGVRDRVRGVYGWSPELRNVARVARAAKQLNNFWSMGMSAFASASDAGAIMARYGFQNVLNDGWQPYLSQIMKNTDTGREFKRQMKAMSIGVETLLNAQQHSMDDVMDGAQPQSKFERALQWGNDKFFIANLLAPFTDQIKIIGAHVVISDILNSAEAVAKGTATAKQLRDLNSLSITSDMATRIYGEYTRGDGGIEKVEGVLLPNTSTWKDQHLAEMFSAAINKEVDARAAITPGEDKPLLFSHQAFSILTQFKGYSAAAHERILIGNLQRRDANVLQGLVFTIMLGMLSYKLTSFLNGRETSDDPRIWFREGVSRSGWPGWAEEGNAIASKLTNGSVDVYRLIGADKPSSRFASRSAADMLLGPTWGKIENARKVIGSAASAIRGDKEKADVPWGESDTHALRSLVLTQNYAFTARLWLEAERGINRSFGIPMRADTQQ